MFCIFHSLKPSSSRAPSTTDNILVPLLQAQPNSAAAQQQQRLQRVLRLHVPVIVRLANRKILLSEVMRLGVGAIIEFVKSSSEPLELMINNKVIGHGETVKVGENFGLRITRIGDPKAIMKAVSGR
jgi:flagellar motor switch protein FliN